MPCRLCCAGPPGPGPLGQDNSGAAGAAAVQPTPLPRGPDRLAPAAAQPAGPRHVHTGPWRQALLPAPLTAGVTPPSLFGPLINGCCCYCCFSLAAALRRAGGGRLGWLAVEKRLRALTANPSPKSPEPRRGRGRGSGRHSLRADTRVERRCQAGGRRREGRAPMSGRNAQAQTRGSSAEQQIAIPAPPSSPGPPVLPR